MYVFFVYVIRLKSTTQSLDRLECCANLRSVSIHGVQLPYAERLRELMLGNTPQPNVKGMYYSLEKCVRDLKGDPSDLNKAMEALQEWDIEKFKEI